MIFVFLEAGQTEIGEGAWPRPRRGCFPEDAVRTQRCLCCKGCHVLTEKSYGITGLLFKHVQNVVFDSQSLGHIDQAGIGISNKRKVPGRCWWELGTSKGWRITRAYRNVHRQSMFVYLCYFIHLDYFDYLCYVIIPVVEQVLAGFCWTCWQYIIRISSGNCEIVTFGIPWVDSIKHSIRHWWMPVIKLRQGKGNKDKHFMTAAKLQALACLIEPVVLWLPWLNDLPSERWLLCRSQCANFDLNPELIVALLWLVLEVFARQSQGSC